MHLPICIPKPSHSAVLPIFLFPILLLWTVHSSQAAEGPNAISFQGLLNGLNEKPLPNGNHRLVFRFWDGPAGGGIPVSTNITLDNVLVSGGFASATIPVDPAWFTGPTRYLGVSINGSDQLLPRVRMTAVPFALNASGVSQSTVTQGPQLSQYRLLLGSEAQGDSSLVMQIDQPNTPQAKVALQGIHSAGNAFADLYINQQGGIVYTGPRLIVGSDSPGRSSVSIGIVATDTEVQAIRSAGSAWGHLIINKNGGNVGIGTDNVTKMLTVAGEAQVGVLTITSDRNAKCGFRKVNNRAILDKLIALPITMWSYTNSPSVCHIGPVAQDFKAAFAVGEEDTHIATVDADGVALSAIQALHRIVQDKSAIIDDLQRRVEALERRLETMSMSPFQK